MKNRTKGNTRTIHLLRNITITDNKTGKIVYRKTVESHSFVVGFLKMLQALLDDRTNISCTDTGNTARTIGYSASALQNMKLFIDAGAGVTDYGIVVGTGTGAESNSDYALGTLIAHGVGAGQLSYGSTSWVDAQVIGVNVDLQILRALVNNSGGEITIEEVAIYARTTDASGNGRYFCIIRDLTGGVAVADGQTATITYTIRTTV